jgi:hypothetical protein
MWFFCFKYWQTAFELKNLFVRVYIAERKKQKLIYLLINVILLTLVFVIYALVYTTTVNKKLKWETAFLGLTLLPVLVILGFYIESIRKMSQVIKVMPFVKRSEKTVFILFLILALYCISTIVVFLLICVTAR